MLIKLLKHDFYATNKVLIGIGCGTILLAITTAVVNLLAIDFITGLFFSFFLIATAVLIILPFGVIIWRYFSNLFGKEGYLTQSLPVKKSSLYLSKAIFAFILTLISVLVLFINLNCGLSLFNLDLLDVFELLNEIPSNYIPAIFIFGSIYFIQMLLTVANLFFSMTLANTPTFVAHNKILSAVIYYAVNVLISLFETVAMVALPLSFNIMDGKFSTNNMLSELISSGSFTASSIGFGSIFVDLILIIVLAFFTIKLLNKKITLR